MIGQFSLDIELIKIIVFKKILKKAQPFNIVSDNCFPPIDRHKTAYTERGAVIELKYVTLITTETLFSEN